MKKFQAIVHFEMDDKFMSFVPPHRTYINFLINKKIIDSYAVSMESQTVWITINAETKAQVDHPFAFTAVELRSSQVSVFTSSRVKCLL